MDSARELLGQGVAIFLWVCGRFDDEFKGSQRADGQGDLRR